MPSTTSATWSTLDSPRISTPPAPSSKASYRRPCPPFPATPWPLVPEPATTSAETISTSSPKADGSHLMVVADVAGGKGLASATLVCTAFRSAFRALARQSLTLRELASRLSQQHGVEGAEARRRYVTAIFLRLDPVSSELEIVNAGHNPAFLVGSPDQPIRLVEASGTPLGMLPGSRYSVRRRMPIESEPESSLYTDGLTEVFRGERIRPGAPHAGLSFHRPAPPPTDKPRRRNPIQVMARTTPLTPSRGVLPNRMI